MDQAAVLLELYGRIPPLAHAAVRGLDPTSLFAAPGPDANSIGWLVWHTARVQDHHVAELLDADQLWVTGDWPARFALTADPQNTGYSHTTAEVRAVVPRSADDLLAYLESVQARTTSWLSGLGGEDLDRIVDRRWDPPVTLGVRLVSVADDGLQHLGQAAYARGILAI
jgi:hypothetical protein